MSFKNFKSISDVQQRYPIYYRETEFISNSPLRPSQTFLEDYAFNMEHLDVLNSESSRRENLIYPILKDVYKHYAENLSLWNEKPLRYNKVLNGIPDYMISVRSPFGKTFLEKPLLVLIEAKKNDFELGWGQCLAELIAAQKLNEDPTLPVYGIVTDGITWQFGKLIDDRFITNKSVYTHSDMDPLFGSLNYILQSATSEHLE